jgi:hypothetical protein
LLSRIVDAKIHLLDTHEPVRVGMPSGTTGSTPRLEAPNRIGTDPDRNGDSSGPEAVAQAPAAPVA